MTRASIVEYIEAVHRRYSGGSNKEKGKILDEFTKVTGCHRKAAIRLIRRDNQHRTGNRRFCPRQYGAAAVGALRVAWEATDHLCSKRLHPFLSEMTAILRRHGESALTAEIEPQLKQINPATIDRLLRPYRRLERASPPLPLPRQAVCLRAPSISVPSPIGKRTALASWKLTCYPIAERALRAST